MKYSSQNATEAIQVRKIKRKYDKKVKLWESRYNASDNRTD